MLGLHVQLHPGDNLLLVSEAMLASGLWLQVVVPEVPLASNVFDTDVLAADVLDDDAFGVLGAAFSGMLEAKASGVLDADAPDMLDADAGVGVEAYDSTPPLNSA